MMDHHCTCKNLNFATLFACAFQRYGVWADWNNPYLTLNPKYEAAQVSGGSKHLNF